MVACNYTFCLILWAFFCKVQYLLFTFSEVRLVFVIYIEEICCRTTCNVDVGEQTFVRTRNLCLVNRRIGLRSSVGNFCFILASPSTLNYWECEERTSKAEKNLLPSPPPPSIEASFIQSGSSSAPLFPPWQNTTIETLPRPTESINPRYDHFLGNML